ncbi:MAG: sulfatase [Planctomycetota bacterium]
MPRWFPLVILLVPLFGACHRSSRAGSTADRHVLLITVEGLRFDAVSAYAPWCRAGSEGGLDHPWQTPNIDRLAGHALLYGYALAPSSWCAPSLAALLCGQYPSDLGFRSLKEPLDGEAVSLAEVLQRAGWHTQAITEHPFLDDQTNLDQGFDQWRHIPGVDARIRQDQAMEAALKAIDSFGAEPQLLWLQLGSLGPPYPDAEGRPGLTRAEWLRDRDAWNEQQLADLRTLYHLEVERIDRAVGQLLDALDRRGMGSRTVVVLCGSNGVELFEHGLIGDATGLSAELTRVPLMLSVSGEVSGAIEDPVSLIDVAPSILRILGRSAPPRWQGVSVLPREPLTDRSLRSELDRVRRQRALLRGDWKLVWDKDWSAPRLFAVHGDPFETKDMADQRGGERAELERELQAVDPAAFQEQ